MNCTIIEQKTIVNGLETSRWFYMFTDPVTNRKRQRLCKDCFSRQEAEEYVSKLKCPTNEQYLIKNIAKDMYVPGKEHMNRLESFGKKLDSRTVSQYRQVIQLIIKDFGMFPLPKVRVSDVEKLLLSDNSHSGSWKNLYLEVFCTIYDETQWKCDKPIPRPVFMKFARHSKKADLLTTEELNHLISRRYYDCTQDYILFLMIASCGLRLGEAIGLRRDQFDFERKIVIVNGFCKRNGERTNYNKTGSDEDTKLRIAPLPDLTIEKLKTYFREYLIGPTDFLFTRNGKRPREEYLRAVFLRVIQRSGIRKGDRKLVPHSLRFTFVTRMRRDLNIETVQKIAGHSSVAMTEYYSRFGISELANSIKESIPAVNQLFK